MAEAQLSLAIGVPTGAEPPNYCGHVAAAPSKTEVLVLNDDMPAEIDFTKGVRGLHHVPPDAKILMPAAA